MEESSNIGKIVAISKKMAANAVEEAIEGGGIGYTVISEEEINELFE